MLSCWFHEIAFVSAFVCNSKLIQNAREGEIADLRWCDGFGRAHTLPFLIHVRLVGSHLVRRKILMNGSQVISQTELSPTCWYKRQSHFVETSCTIAPVPIDKQ